MRALPVWPLVLGLVGGCVTDTSSAGGADGWGTGPGGTGGPIGAGCSTDQACGAGRVCARDGECLAATDVQIVYVGWTIAGQPAGATTCARSPDLDITFRGAQADPFGFAPVPCVEGKFTVDKMPKRYAEVALEPACRCKPASTAAFDSTGSATLDLAF